MTQDQKTIAPNDTAVRTALWRALHTQIDAEPHILNDAIGLKLIAPAEGWQLRPDMHAEFTKRLRASVVARSRFVEDIVVAKCEKGIAQYVILGAGLDTFVQRNPETVSKLQVFEIDEADTLNWKQKRLNELGYGIASELHFVPVNFEVSSWWEELVKAGFQKEIATVVSCTGVSLYLTQEANIEMLKQMAMLAPGSVLAVAFYLPKDLLDEQDRFLQEISEKGAREAGTPFVSFFTPDAIRDLAHQAGLKNIILYDNKNMEELYFKDRQDNFLPASGEVFLVATI